MQTALGRRGKKKTLTSRALKSYTMMYLFLALIFFASAASLTASVKEWKIFENGEVYSHKMPDDQEQHKNDEVQKDIILGNHSPEEQEKIQHQQANPSQAPKLKQSRKHTPQRHHKKSVEEEMHLKPLNERHHKFPNPALLNMIYDPKSANAHLSKQKLLRQVKPE